MKIPTWVATLIASAIIAIAAYSYQDVRQSIDKMNGEIIALNIKIAALESALKAKNVIAYDAQHRPVALVK